MADGQQTTTQTATPQDQRALGSATQQQLQETGRYSTSVYDPTLAGEALREQLIRAQQTGGVGYSPYIQRQLQTPGVYEAALVESQKFQSGLSAQKAQQLVQEQLTIQSQQRQYEASHAAPIPKVEVPTTTPQTPQATTGGYSPYANVSLRGPPLTSPLYTQGYAAPPKVSVATGGYSTQPSLTIKEPQFGFGATEYVQKTINPEGIGQKVSELIGGKETPTLGTNFFKTMSYASGQFVGGAVSGAILVGPSTLDLIKEATVNPTRAIGSVIAPFTSPTIGTPYGLGQLVGAYVGGKGITEVSKVGVPAIKEYTASQIPASKFIERLPIVETGAKIEVPKAVGEFPKIAPSLPYAAEIGTAKTIIGEEVSRGVESAKQTLKPYTPTQISVVTTPYIAAGKTLVINLPRAIEPIVKSFEPKEPSVPIPATQPLELPQVPLPKGEFPNIGRAFVPEISTARAIIGQEASNISKSLESAAYSGQNFYNQQLSNLRTNIQPYIGINKATPVLEISGTPSDRAAIAYGERQLKTQAALGTPTDLSKSLGFMEKTQRALAPTVEFAPKQVEAITILSKEIMPEKGVVVFKPGTGKIRFETINPNKAIFGDVGEVPKTATPKPKAPELPKGAEFKKTSGGQIQIQLTKEETKTITKPKTPELIGFLIKPQATTSAIQVEKARSSVQDQLQKIRSIALPRVTPRVSTATLVKPISRTSTQTIQVVKPQTMTKPITAQSVAQETQQITTPRFATPSLQTTEQFTSQSLKTPQIQLTQTLFPNPDLYYYRKPPMPERKPTRISKTNAPKTKMLKGITELIPDALSVFREEDRKLRAGQQNILVAAPTVTRKNISIYAKQAKAMVARFPTAEEIKRGFKKSKGVFPI